MRLALLAWQFGIRLQRILFASDYTGGKIGRCFSPRGAILDADQHLM
jgi:hypothetical protein